MKRTTRPSVSVIVPTYRSACYLQRMIHSVITQTFTDWELVIVDGRSADGTRDVINRYRRRLGSRLVFIDQTNQGCCHARNTGIEASRGKYVAFLDSDDEFTPTKLARQLELFGRRPDIGMVFCDFRYIDFESLTHESAFETHTPLIKLAPFEEISPGLRVCTPDFTNYLLRQYLIATITGVVRRDILADDVRFDVGNSLGFAEWLFFLEVARRTRVGYVNEPLCLHHFEQGSLTRTSTRRNSIHQHRLARSLCKHMGRDEPFASCATATLLHAASYQLGLECYRNREFSRAARYFCQAAAERCDVRSLAYSAQSLCRWIASTAAASRLITVQQRRADRRRVRA